MKPLSGRTRVQAKQREKGSALLIVFVFAAIVAIMLYMELPVAAFEAQRQKEQLLIDRGHEYAQAVRLYVRKFGSYPPSMEALENTNQIRFLRHRYKDPLTGKDDWRLLHAGPGGILTDSKVNPLPTGANGSKTASSPAFGSTGSSSNAFGSGFMSSSSSSSSSPTATSAWNVSSNSTMDLSADQTTVAHVPQRPPAIAANGASPQQPGATDLQSSPTESLLGGQMPANPGAQNSTAMQPALPGAGNQPGVMPGPGAQAVPGDPNQALRNLMANPNPPTPPGTPATAAPVAGAPTSAGSSSSSGSQMGVISGGGGIGIAGVASKAHGDSIKTVNEQTDYSLWEFYYDPTKDPMRNASLQTGLQTGGQQNLQNSNTSSQNTSSQNTNSSSAGAGNTSSQNLNYPASATNPGQSATPGMNPAPVTGNPPQ